MYIDLSKWNNDVSSWEDLRNNKVKGIILRVGFRGYDEGTIVDDKKYMSFAKGCKDNNIPFGLYFFSQSINGKEAIEEATYTVNMAKKYGATLPLFFDSEKSGKPNNNGRADHLDKKTRTACARAFCEEVEKAGYKAGIYASTSWFETDLNIKELTKWYLWVAQYATKCTATHKVDMWQFTNKGIVKGVEGDIDCSECYVNFITGERIG